MRLTTEESMLAIIDKIADVQKEILSILSRTKTDMSAK